MPMPFPLEEVKLWLRVDHDEEDTILQSIIAAAEEYLRSSLPSWIDPAKNPPAKILALVIIADLYENRGTVSEIRHQAQLLDHRPTVQSLLAQLKYAYPSIETTQLPDAQVGAEYSASVYVSGGSPPYKWQVIAGELPPGLALDETNGKIAGTPTSATRCVVTVEVQDSDNRTASRPVTITVVDSS